MQTIVQEEQRKSILAQSVLPAVKFIELLSISLLHKETLTNPFHNLYSYINAYYSERDECTDCSERTQLISFNTYAFFDVRSVKAIKDILSVIAKKLWPLEITLLFLILTVHQQLSSISQRISCQKCFNDDVGSFRYQRYRYRYCSTRNEKYQDRGFEQEEHLCDDEAKIYIKEKQNFELRYHFFATVKIMYISCSGVPRFF